MSVVAIRRSFTVIHYLKAHGEARFTDLVRHLIPVSRSALSHLLSSLVEIGEVERHGRLYRLAPASTALIGNDRSIYALPPALLSRTRPIMEKTALELMHSCALFAPVGTSTMKIMDEHNLVGAHWPFTPTGYEWPLVPFHAFARVFLAHASEAVARDCYVRWHPYLQPHLRMDSYRQFRTELDKIRKQGYAVDNKDEVSTIMRVVVPVHLPDDKELRFAIGIVANFVYLLQVKSCLRILRATAQEVAGVLKGNVPDFCSDKVPEKGEHAWMVRPFKEA
jgi:DNA-binding IclR family transcriptional regulator